MVTRAWQRLALPVTLLGLALLAAWPLLRLGYPTAGDGLIHFYRLVQLDHLLRAGVWYPRWAADLAYGFGYPVFHYYSPLAYYAGAGLHALGLSYAQALLGVYALGLGLAVTGAYALAADRWGRAAGLAAAAAYGLAPYFYFNALARGALPETVGLGLLPWVLWAYARLARQPTPSRFLAAALLNAVLILTHLLSALLAAPLVVLVWFVENRNFRIPSYQLPLTSYLLSLALSAFFLLPALLELDAVQVLQLTTPGDLDFHNHFLSLTQLLAWPRPYDARLVFNAVPPSLSLAAAVFVGAGLMARGPRLRAPGATHTAFAHAAAGQAAVSARRWLRTELIIAAALLVLVTLALPVSVGVWERVPLLRLVQFPWRLVGPASLLLALLAGASVARAAARWRFGPLLPAAVLLGVWVWSLAWSYGPASQAPTSARLSDLHAYERTTGQLGTTSTGEFLPAAVRELPDPLTLEAAYANGRPTARLATLPPGVTVLSQSAGPTRAAAEIDAAAPATLTFNLFDFPGWTATVDGEPAAISASDPHGLITVPVPAGRHRVEVRFGTTPLRAGAGLLSLLAALTLVLSARLVPHARTGINHFTPSPPHPIILSLLVTLFAVRLLFDPLPPFARTRFDGANVAGVAQPLDVNFDNQLVLIGLEGLPENAAADDALVLTLYWRAQTVPAADYSTTVQVLDKAGHLFGQSDSQHPGRVPTRRWRTDQYARDEHHLRLLPGTPPGTYRLVAGVYRVDGPSLAVLDANQVPQGHLAELGTLIVTRARRPSAPEPAHALDVPLGPLRLRGYSLNTLAPQAGDLLRLTLFWQAEAAPRLDAAVRLSLLAADGTVLAETTQPPAAAYPSSMWAVGEVVRHPLDLRVPANVQAGDATLAVSLVPATAPGDPPLDRPVDLAVLDLRVPARQFTPPALQQVLNADVGAGVTLLGYDLAPTGAITLYWQPHRLLEASYKVFVHALAADGRLLTQSDTLPAAGTRPTTGWLPNEVIADTHTLPLAGAARLAAGLYDEATGERLGSVTIDLP